MASAPTAKTQVSLYFLTVRPEATLFLKYAPKDTVVANAKAEDFDLTSQMRRLIRVFAGCICCNVYCYVS